MRRGLSPRLIPTHEVRKHPISTSTDESIGITFAVWAIIPWGGHSYTKTPPRDVLSIRYVMYLIFLDLASPYPRFG